MCNFKNIYDTNKMYRAFENPHGERSAIKVTNLASQEASLSFAE